MKSVHYTHMEGHAQNFLNIFGDFGGFRAKDRESLYSSEDEVEIHALVAPLESKCPCGLPGFDAHTMVGILGRPGSISCRACKFEYNYIEDIRP